MPNSIPKPPTQIVGRRVIVKRPETGFAEPALVDIHVVDRRTGLWYRAEIPRGAGRQVPCPVNWRYANVTPKGGGLPPNLFFFTPGFPDSEGGNEHVSLTVSMSSPGSKHGATKGAN